MSEEELKAAVESLQLCISDDKAKLRRVKAVLACGLIIGLAVLLHQWLCVQNENSQRRLSIQSCNTRPLIQIFQHFVGENRMKTKQRMIITETWCEHMVILKCIQQGF